MNDRRLGLILKRLGHVLHELGDFIILAVDGDEERHERPTADPEAPTERATDAPVNLVEPGSELEQRIDQALERGKPAREALKLRAKLEAERQVEDIGRVLELEFRDEDAPDLGQAPSNLGNGPVPLFIDGDEDPEDEVLAEQAEFTVGEPERG